MAANLSGVQRAFFRFVAVSIETDGLSTENYERQGKKETYEFTTKSKVEIGYFVELAMIACNDTHHLTMTATPQEV
jgi:hypothetical protein